MVLLMDNRRKKEETVINDSETVSIYEASQRLATSERTVKNVD